MNDSRYEVSPHSGAGGIANLRETPPLQGKGFAWTSWRGGSSSKMVVMRAAGVGWRWPRSWRLAQARRGGR
jgi:hypothetical protein